MPDFRIIRGEDDGILCIEYNPLSFGETSRLYFLEDDLNALKDAVNVFKKNSSLKKKKEANI
jgi:hypothetical protein